MGSKLKRELRIMPATVKGSEKELAKIDVHAPTENLQGM